jgi:radical SAM superfamily enzyme YgiQ (UPF0313 family)
MKYREPLFRPPSEGDSLIFQIAYGCPHNTCLFCPMYKGVNYSVRQKDDVLNEIKKASEKNTETRRIFLADGDVMNLPYEYLEQIFIHLNRYFPKLSRISMYANGSSILAKSSIELENLKKLKLFTLYLGLESGDEEVLSLVHKGETAEQMTAAVQLAQTSGIRMSVMVLLGLAGKELSKQHAERTAVAVNKMSPKFLAALRFVQAPGLKMFKNYVTLSEHEVIQELYTTVENLNLTNTVFRANHASNPIPIAARFPKDKGTLLTSLNNLLNNSSLDRNSSGHLPIWL